MKCAYEAANGVEAHMVANLLEQHSITSRIDGEYLAGGVGDLPASGLVRVMVEPNDYDRARQIIREWEAKSPPDKPQAPRPRSLAPVWFLFGFVVAFAVMSLFYRSQAAIEGTDYNGDGRLDETYSYEDGRLSKVEGDANLDGRIDYVYRLDDKGLPQNMQVDYDFDGRFEVKQSFERRNTKRVEIDWDMDGHVDRREDYVNGVLDTVTLYAPDGYRVVKRERFSGGQLIDAEYDSDGDGVTETLYRYDRYGEISECSPRATCEFRSNPR